MKKLIPFWMLPASWGLRGDLLRRARAEYELSGEDLDRELAAIEHGHNQVALKRAGLKIDFKYNHISRYTMEIELAKLDLTGAELERKLVDIDRRFDKITERQAREKIINIDYSDQTERSIAHARLKAEYGEIDQTQLEKTVCTLQQKPWVIVKSIDTDSKNPGMGSIELDWNEHFVTMLENAGYGPAPHPEQVVDQWLTDLCKNIALEQLDGVGEWSERLSKSHPDVVKKHELDQNGDYQ